MTMIRWVGFIGLVCNEWLKRTSGKELQNLKIISSWFVRQFKNEYNPVHHLAGHISGVGYLKFPRNLGKTVQENKQRNSNGYIVSICGSTNLFLNSTIEITPEAGDF